MQISDLWTENDGKTLCPVRVVGLLGAGQFLAAAAHAMWTGSIDLAVFGEALMKVIAAVGFAFSAKNFVESRNTASGDAP